MVLKEYYRTFTMFEDKHLNPHFLYFIYVVGYATRFCLLSKKLNPGIFASTPNQERRGEVAAAVAHIFINSYSEECCGDNVKAHQFLCFSCHSAVLAQFWNTPEFRYMKAGRMLDFFNTLFPVAHKYWYDRSLYIKHVGIEADKLDGCSGALIEHVNVCASLFDINIRNAGI